MKTRYRLLAITLTSILLATGNTWASRVSYKMSPHAMDRHDKLEYGAFAHDATIPMDSDESSTGVVFETVDLFKNRTYFTEAFHIDTAGTYQVILTDFEFPNPLKKSALNITTATESLGSLSGPGSFTFEADPGRYYVSFFAQAGGGGHSRRHHHRDDDEHSRRKKHDDDDGGFEHPEYSDLTWYVDPSFPWYGNRHGHDYGYKAMKLGQYGIEISQVPVPAAAWLFGSGLLGLAGIARRRSRR